MVRITMMMTLCLIVAHSDALIIDMKKGKSYILTMLNHYVAQIFSKSILEWERFTPKMTGTSILKLSALHIGEMLIIE